MDSANKYDLKIVIYNKNLSLVSLVYSRRPSLVRFDTHSCCRLTNVYVWRCAADKLSQPPATQA